MGKHYGRGNNGGVRDEAMHINWSPNEEVRQAGMCESARNVSMSGVNMRDLSQQLRANQCRAPIVGSLICKQRPDTMQPVVCAGMRQSNAPKPLPLLTK